MAILQALQSRGLGGRLPTPPKMWANDHVSFLKEVIKNVHENQYTSKLKKHNILLLIGFYQVENIKSETLFNSIKDDLGRIDD